MKFFYKLEQKYRKYAIHNLMYYIVILYAVGLLFYVFAPGAYLDMYMNYLCLDAQKILHGQIWRIVTFLVFPPSFGSMQFTTILFGILALFVYHNLGQTLENVWGSFRFNVFFFMGVLAQVLACIIGYLVFDEFWLLTTGYINASIFLAFAICFPDVQFLLFYLIPVKAWWLAVAEAAMYLYSFIVGTASIRCELVVSLINVIVFFILTRRNQISRFSPKEIQRKQKFKSEVKIVPKSGARHRCAVCGRTELDGEHLEFRYCSKCAGGLEYCQDHLYTHQHVVEDVNHNDQNS